MSDRPMSFRRWNGSRFEKGAEDLSEPQTLEDILYTVETFAKTQRGKAHVWLLLASGHATAYAIPKRRKK